MTDPLSAILKSILLEPDVDLHRLAFADRLEEEGDKLALARAEFIRDSLADPHGGQYTGDVFVCRANRPHAGIPEDWAEDWGVQIRWGFVRWVQLPAADWLRCADAILACHPVREVKLTTLPAIQGRHQGRCRLHGRERWHAVGWSDPRDALPYLLRQEWPGIKFELPRAVSGPANLYVNGNFLGTATAWEGGILHGNPEAGKPLGTINVKETVKQVAKNVAEAWVRSPAAPARPVEEDLSVEDAIREARLHRRRRKA